MIENSKSSTPSPGVEPGCPEGLCSLLLPLRTNSREGSAVGNRRCPSQFEADAKPLCVKG